MPKRSEGLGDVQFRVLGRVQLTTDVELTADDDKIDVGPAKHRAMLGVLALRVGQLVTVPHPIAAVWGRGASAKAPVQGHVHRLRTKLRTADPPVHGWFPECNLSPAPAPMPPQD